MAFGIELTSDNLAKIGRIVAVVAVLGVGAAAVISTQQQSLQTEIRELSNEMERRFGTGGAYTTAASEDVTAIMINGGTVPASLVDRSTAPPTIRHRDNGAITLTLTPTQRQITLAALGQTSCIGLIEGMDANRSLRAVSVNGTGAAFTNAAPATSAALRAVAATCAQGDNAVVLAWGR
jgi:hypothetical protein